MNLILYLAVVISTGLNIVSHDTPLAMFHITELESDIMVDVTFHQEDFVKSAKVSADELNEEVLQNYLQEHTKFRINSELLPLEVRDLSIKKNHIRVKGKLIKIEDKVEILKFSNTCLIDIMGHENNVLVNLNGITNSYRMNRRRKVIRIRY